MHVSELPGELISGVFLYINRANLYECMKVCKKWHRIGSVRYYKNSKVTDNYVKFLKLCKIPYFDGTCVGDFVEDLTLSSGDYTPENQVLSQEQFGQLIYSLPHLRVLRFDPGNDKQTIMKYMNYFQIIARHTNVEEVAVPEMTRYMSGYLRKNTRKIRRYHYMINRVLHNQISSLTIYDLEIRMLKGDVNRLLSSLSRFKTLKQLILHVRSSVDWYPAEEKLFVSSVLNARPHLEYLEFHSSRSWLDPINYDRVYDQLTSLTVVIPDLNKNNVKFLIKHVPNLKHLDLDIYYKSSLVDILSLLDTKTTAQFMSYLKRIDYVSIKSASMDNNPDMELFWETMRELYEPSMRCNMKILFRSRMTYIQNFSFDRNTNIFTVYSEWILHELLDPGWVRHVDFFDFASLDIQYEDYVNGDVLFSEIIHPTLLVSQPCVNFINKESSITLNDGNSDSFTPIYERPMIRCAKLADLNSEDCKTLLSTACTHYPLIEEITLENCRFFINNENNEDIDLQPFANLQKLTIDLGLISLNDFYVQHHEDAEYYHFKYHILRDSSNEQDEWDKKILKISCAKPLTTLTVKDINSNLLLDQNNIVE